MWCSSVVSLSKVSNLLFHLNVYRAVIPLVFILKMSNTLNFQKKYKNKYKGHLDIHSQSCIMPLFYKILTICSLSQSIHSSIHLYRFILLHNLFFWVIKACIHYGPLTLNSLVCISPKEEYSLLQPQYNYQLVVKFTLIKQFHLD